jgi:hypothetical protein
MFNDPFDRWLFAAALATLTGITAYAVLSLLHDLREERARRALAERPTLPAMQTLPALIPASYLDASDTTPDQANTYCLACWLEWISMPWRDYFAPEGIAVFCERHAYLTLARALSAQQQQRETGDKYL